VDRVPLAGFVFITMSGKKMRLQLAIPEPLFSVASNFS
jgi:hypothetical protein